MQENNCLARIGIYLARKIFPCKNCKSKILQIYHNLASSWFVAAFLQVLANFLHVLPRWFYLAGYITYM